MSAAEIIPIALVLDERTGYTLWAPPWTEDGEEWQAFLGIDDKILLFATPGQLAQYLRRDEEHDLSDHPDWEEWEDSDPFELNPDDDHTFDLDGVYEIVAQPPDRWSVTDLGRTLGIVDAIAQCTDEDIVEPVADTPELTLVADGPGAFTGSRGDRAWDKVAIAISGHWETVCERVGEWLDWREAVDLDDDIAKAQGEIDAMVIPVDDPDALIEAEDEANQREGDDEDFDDLTDPEDDDDDIEYDEDDDLDDEDEDDDLDDEDEDDEDLDDAGEDDLDDDEDVDDDTDDLDEDDDVDIDSAAAYAFWEDVGILPIRLVLPGSQGGTELYTLRCYLDDRAVFIGAGEKPWLFTSPDVMLDVIEQDDENDHDLRTLATWSEVVTGVRDDDVPLAIAGEDDVDLAEVDEIIRGKGEYDAETVAQAGDLLLDLAEYAGLDTVRTNLEDDGPLADLITSARNGEDVTLSKSARSKAINAWESAVRQIAGSFEQID